MSSSVDTGDHTGILLAAVTMCVWQYYRSQQNVKKFENAYWGERRGRARVEQEMKRISNIQLNTDEGFFVQPIGEIHSCYRQCIGTPRQGLLAPASRATIKLNNHISPESLVGLETFSHVWITFKFHLNTNTLKESKNFSSRSTFNAKITLPMLKKKLGVFATRSPHRPNPVGVTLAKIDRFDKKTRTLYLNGCDLVEGTPVLDVKPYVPAYDSVPPEDSRIPEWIQDTVYTRNTVVIRPHCLEFVRKVQSSLVQYKNDADAYIAGLTDTLAAEVRSKFQTSRRMNDASHGEAVEVPFDETIVKFYWASERSFEIVDIELRAKNKAVLIEQALLVVAQADTAAHSTDDMLRLASGTGATASAGAGASEDQVQGQGQDQEEGSGQGQGVWHEVEDVEVDDVLIAEEAF